MNPVTLSFSLKQPLGDLMPGFTITRHIGSPVDVVWSVLDDFGSIQEWNPGVAASALTSDGPVGHGSTRTCDFGPIGGVKERITTYEQGEKMTIHLYETFKLPISEGEADFNLAPSGDGTELTLHYTYTPNLVGKVMGPITKRMLERGIGGLAKSLAQESERIHTASAG